MSKGHDHITVFEHETIRFDKGEKRISEDQFLALQAHHGEGVPYYSLCYNGVRFNEYVGVIQIGTTIIEVLPKADKPNDNEGEQGKWREILIGMLKAVGSIDIRATSNSQLKIKANSILDLYFEIFIYEVEYLLRNGLAKKYRKKEGNVTALKGSLHFARHIQYNVTHQERFYVRYTTYDVTHRLHCILYKTICLLKQINTNVGLHSRIGALLLHFPEMPDLKVTGLTFQNISLDRKTSSYKKAVDIARLLLLRYHPDVSKGRHHVLALMLDMNALWEQFVYVSLRKHKMTDTIITAQTTKYFWKPANGHRSKMRPDILVRHGETTAVLDTKWKYLNGYNPSPDDLRQMYVYHEYYEAEKVALVYPGSETSSSAGRYLETKDTDKESCKECSVISLGVEANVGEWQRRIYEQVAKWVGMPLTD